MSTASEVVAQIREDREKRKAEEARWARLRAEANPPVWFVVLAVVAGSGGMLALAAYFLKHPDVMRSPVGPLIVPCAAILSLIAWLAQRREKAIVKAIKEESPALFEKLKTERLIR
jgi:hypothetical protein